MKLFVALLSLALSLHAYAAPSKAADTQVRIPYMDRPGLHRVYADELLDLVLRATVAEFGPYRITQQTKETVIARQLAQMANNRLSVAVAMPSPDWEQHALRVPFPIMKGLGSYRLFFTTSEYQAQLDKVKTLADLKKFKVGQGRGWSTANILQSHGFDVVFAPDYSALFPMLKAGRYQLLMRGVYEMEVELFAQKGDIPNLAIAENIAVYTYLPMYFYVSKSEPALARRIEQGLIKLHESGELDELFQQHFWSSLALLDIKNRKVFSLSNSNIDPSYIEHDKPYLLGSILSTP